MKTSDNLCKMKNRKGQSMKTKDNHWNPIHGARIMKYIIWTMKRSGTGKMKKSGFISENRF
jgi:hypothetical protein